MKSKQEFPTKYVVEIDNLNLNIIINKVISMTKLSRKHFHDKLNIIMW